MNVEEIRAIQESENQVRIMGRTKASICSGIADLNKTEGKREEERSGHHNELSARSWHEQIAGYALAGPRFNARLNQVASGLRTVVSILARNSTVRADQQNDSAEANRALTPFDECGLMDAADYLAAEVVNMVAQLHVEADSHLNPVSSQF